MSIEIIGKWYIRIWESKNKIIEIGIGKNYAKGNYGIFMSKARTFLFFYLVVSRPTLTYMKQTGETK